VREHSEAFKSKLVQRMLMPGGPSANALSQEVGVSQPTLSRWLREAATLEAVTKRRKRAAARPSRPPEQQRRPEDRSAEQKLRLVLEASALPEVELGEFMRRHGLHEADLAAWREMALGALGGTSAPSNRSGDARRVRGKSPS
jgi:transposase